MSRLLFPTLLLLAIPAAAQFECSTRAFDPPGLRNRGQAELLGDLVIVCQGIRPAQGILANIQVNLNVPLTSRVLSSGNSASEALLLLDDPAPQDQLAQPAGSNVPGANVIQGVQSAATSVSFFNVPFVAPGQQSFLEKIVRIVNLKANVTNLAVNATVTAQVSFSGNISVTGLGNSAVALGTVARPLDVSVRIPDDSALFSSQLNGCLGNNLNVSPGSARDFNIRFAESFATEFRERNIATSPNNWFATGDQNDPTRGIRIYGTETGFFSSGFPSSTGMNQAGFASQGTRLMARFSGIPGGASVFVTAQPVSAGTSGSGITARLTQTSEDGAGVYLENRALLGPYVQLPVSSGAAQAVWEVFDANATQLESLSFGVIVSVPAGTLQSSTVRITGLYGPAQAQNTGSTPYFTATGVDPITAVEVRGCAPQLSIVTPCPIEPASVGVPFSRPLSASGGTLPYTWSLISGNLPPGVALSAAGLISGTATEAGTFPFRMRVSDVTGATATIDCAITIQPALTISTACPLPDASLGAQYSQLLGAIGGVPPYTWTISRGGLPSGLTLARTGTISGSPSSAGIFSFALQVTDARTVSGQKDCSLRVQAPLRVGPVSLSFSAPAGSGPTIPQVLSLLNEPAGQSWSLRVLTENGGDWLKVTPTTGKIPAAIEVSVVPGTLREGAYSGSLTILTQGQGQAQQSVGVAVNFEVKAARPVQVAVQPAGAVVTVPRGTSRADRTFWIINRGSGSFAYAAVPEVLNGERWFEFSALAGRVAAGTPVRLPVTLRTADLAAGVYRARIRVTNNDTGDVTLVPVTLAVGGTADAMAVEPLSTSISTAPGQTPAPVSLTIAATGAGPVNWQGAVTTNPNLPRWLTLAPVTGRATSDTPSQPELRVDTTGLAAGRYFGEVAISAPGIENSPRTVLVKLTVENTATGGVVIQPSSLLFTTNAGVQPSRQFVTLINTSRNAMSFDVDLAGDSAVWSATPPADRIIPSGGSARVEVAANPGRVTAGVTSAKLNIQTSLDQQVRTVDLGFAVNAALRPSANTQDGPVRQIDAVCPPGGLRIHALNPGTGFRATQSEPMPVEAAVFENNGTPTTSGLVTVTLGSTTATLMPAAGGRWVGAITPSVAEPGPAVLSLLAEDRSRSALGCQDLLGAVQANSGPAPVIAEGGVLSTASFQPYAPLAPGGMAAIFGTALAEGASTGGVPPPDALGTTQVRFGSSRMPLFFAGDNGSFSQVNGIVPYGVAPNVAHQLIITTPAGQATSLVPVAAAQPGVFALNQRGTGQGIVVQGLNPLLIADANTPISRGDIVVIYLEGLGAVTPPVVAGQLSPGNPVARANATVTVTIDGKEAPVQFAGLTPGLIGLYQVNAVVPTTATPGAAVPVVVTAAGQSSPPVTIAVQ